jgi:hypothetical protein
MRFILCILLTLASAQSQASQEIKSQGACSPNIIENKGEVKFTCLAKLDAATVNKLNQVLNDVFARGSQSSEVSAKLDEILNFIHHEAPREINETQMKDFLRMVGTGAKGSAEVFLVGSDPESFRFSRAIGDLLTSGGWTITYKQGIVVNGDPSGVLLTPRDIHDKNAILLQQSLEAIGVRTPGQAGDEKQEPAIILRVGPKPLAQ